MNDVAITRRYLILRPRDKQTLARVTTKWVLVDLTQHKVMMIPEAAKQTVVVLKKHLAYRGTNDWA